MAEPVLPVTGSAGTPPPGLLTDKVMVADYPDHPATQFFAVWQQLCGTHPLPPRNSFKPALAPHVLPWLVVFDIEQENALTGPEFRFRLLGDEADRLYSRPMKGRLVSEALEEPFRSDRMVLLRKTWAQRAPLFGAREVSVAERAFIKVLFGNFPFDGGEQGSQIFLVLAPHKGSMISQYKS